MRLSYFFLVVTIIFAWGRPAFSAKPSSQDKESVSINTYYPIPRGVYRDLEIEEAFDSDPERSMTDALPRGVVAADKGVILKKWTDSYPENPKEGQMFYHYDSATGKKSLAIFRRDSWREMPAFVTQEVQIKVHTPLPSLYICGQPARSGQWVECDLRPAVTDSFGGCRIAAVNRSCGTSGCTLSFAGSENYSLSGEVEIKVQARDNFEVSCEDRTDTFLGHCNASMNAECGWTGSMAYGRFSSNCAGCPAWCNCSPGMFYLRYRSP